MLALNLTRIRTANERFDQVYQPDQVAQDVDALKIASPATLGFDIFKDKAHFRLVGSLATTLELPCGRCLEPFTLPVEASFDLRYQPHAANSGEGEREIEEDDLSTAFYENETIDLGELMREQFYLALPMKPLCGENCLGLCTLCGTNLNRETCSCRRDWEDPRLAVLKVLKKPDAAS